MRYVMKKLVAFPGSGLWACGILETAGSAVLAMEMQVAVEEIQSMVLGRHGDDMAPVLSVTTVPACRLPSCQRQGPA